MPPIGSLASKRYTYIILTILLLGKIIPTYSYCEEKKLVYIAISAPSGCQPSSYTKYTRVNIQLFCNVWSVSNAQYIYLISL